MSLNQLSVKEAANVSLGGVGCFIEDGTTAITGKKIVAIQFLSDTTFTTLTPNSSAFIGTSDGNGDDIDTNNTFPTGLTLFGQFTGFTLATGSVIAYEGAF